MRGRLIVIAALGALVAIAAVAPALAGSQKVKHFTTTISIKTDKAAGTISGKFTSAKSACAEHRAVILNVDGSDVPVKPKVRTNQSGRYGIVHGSRQNPKPLDPGDYEVHARPKQLTPHKVCDAGNSKIVHVN